MAVCPACSAPVPDGFAFCPGCGTAAGAAPSRPKCLYCHAGIDGPIARCPSCASMYHSDCYVENEGCASLRCDQWTGRVAPGSVPAVIDGEEPEPEPDGSGGVTTCGQCGAPAVPGMKFCQLCGHRYR